MQRIARAGLVASAMIGSLLLVGCKEEAEMTQAEKENFKGGPMPPGFMEKNPAPKGPQ